MATIFLTVANGTSIRIRTNMECSFGFLTHAVTQRGAIGLRIREDDDNYYSFMIPEGYLDPNYGSLVAFIQSDNDYSASDSFVVVELRFDFNNRFVLRWDQNNQRFEFVLYYNADKHSVNIAAPIEANMPYMVASSWGSGIIKIYFNGDTEILEKSGDVPIPTFPARAYVGNSITAPEPFVGIVWSVAILNKPLDDPFFDFYEKFYRNLRPADFLQTFMKRLWYGGHEGKQRYRLGN